MVFFGDGIDAFVRFLLLEVSRALEGAARRQVPVGIFLKGSATSDRETTPRPISSHRPLLTIFLKAETT